MNQKILKLVCAALADAGEELGKAELGQAGPETRLYGRQGLLDSLGLVNVIADVEQRVADGFDKTITLADERAMSQRRSPFASVATLVDYIEQLLREG
jgi:acyl carrier protein